MGEEDSASLAATSFVVDSSATAAAPFFASFLAAFAAFLASRFSRKVSFCLVSSPCWGVDWLAPMALAF